MANLVPGDLGLRNTPKLSGGGFLEEANAQFAKSAENHLAELHLRLFGMGTRVLFGILRDDPLQKFVP